MNKNVIGIDLGTSSVKILQLFSDGTSRTSRASYKEISKEGWWEAVCRGLARLELDQVEAISLSSQVGTYMINETEVISWNCNVGKEEIEGIKKSYTEETFLKEISMMHPNISSYPIPRLKYIKKHFEEVKSVCQPKDALCKLLTGNLVTDPYSWRGLANLEKKCYSEFFLQELGITKEQLPEMIDAGALAGITKEIPLLGNTLPSGIPVYTGLNDYYASLLGMGIKAPGEMFDISGTSEHLGVIEEEIHRNTEMVSGPYLQDYVHYGVTASSGVSIKFGLRLLEDKVFELEKIQKKETPIFLPYLNGERAPIWDGDARGMFFGICEQTGAEELAYAAFEGVVFSLYHIYESMGKPRAQSMKISGGAAVFPILNRLKAEMFGIPVEIMAENETSALGAAMIAAVGAGWYEDLQTAMAAVCKIKETMLPTGIYKEWLDKRYLIYKELYPAVKLQYEKLKEIRE